VGLAALFLARDWNLTTIATTRNPAKAALLTERGADDVLVDTGDDAFTGLAEDYVLDLIGAHSALGSSFVTPPPRGYRGTGAVTRLLLLPGRPPASRTPSRIRRSS
jgi:NADPH:quinone reductase-like Zn-dependent oxidoreductase